MEFAWARRWLRSARALLPWRFKDDSGTPEEVKHAIGSAQRDVSASAGAPDVIAKNKGHMMLVLLAVPPLAK